MTRVDWNWSQDRARTVKERNWVLKDPTSSEDRPEDQGSELKKVGDYDLGKEFRDECTLEKGKFWSVKGPTRPWRDGGVSVDTGRNRMFTGGRGRGVWHSWTVRDWTV